MNSRERVVAAINHEVPDQVPVDLGSTVVTGISASTLYRLRQAMGLPDEPVRVQQLTQMLGEVDAAVRTRLGADVVGLFNPTTFSGGIDRPTQKLVMSDGTPTLIPAAVAFERTPEGAYFLYPQNDKTARPSLVMPAGGYFFEGIDRSAPFDEDNLTPVEDFANTFMRLTERDAQIIESRSFDLANTGLAVIGVLNCGSLGDVALLPGRDEREPRGIRRLDDWYAAHLLYPDYIKAVFRLQTDIALRNLELYRQAVGDRIQILHLSSTDLGTQMGPMIGLTQFRELYKPFYAEMNAWVHEHTAWKTFYHSCGSVVSFIPDFIDMGVDILNPVQMSAAGMGAARLKAEFGDKIVFWGGGVDTQKTLPFGTPAEVRQEVLGRLAIMSEGGGYVFNPVHNVLAKTPVENLLAAFDAVAEFNGR